MRDHARRLLVVVAAILALAPRIGVAEDFKNGEMIDQSNWQKAEALLPPEILRHY